MTSDASPAAEWVSQLVRIPSVNPMQTGPKAGVAGEKALAEFVADRLDALGAQVEFEEDPDNPGRPNVYAVFPGESDRWVGLDVHTDTVGVEHMTVDPFDGRVEDGRVWGRGSVDTKASMGVMLSVLEELAREGRRPRPNLLVVGTISEEGGGLIGATVFGEWLRRRGLVLDELIVAEPTECAPIYGHKGGVGMDITVLGRAAHTSKPELGANAIEAAAAVILALKAEHERLAGQSPRTEVGVGTLTTALVSGGSARNIVPDRCTLTVGRRLVPYETPDEVFAALRDLVERSCPLPVEVTAISEGSPAFYQSPDSTFIQTLAGWSGRPPETAPYGTNALRYDGAAAEIAVLGPGSIDQAHAAVEWVEISELEKLAGLYRRWLS
ncbi:MAG: M20/M25/M40 family metallo-hydrolase [Acidimicrobiales bacterium]